MMHPSHLMCFLLTGCLTQAVRGPRPGQERGRRCQGKCTRCGPLLLSASFLQYCIVLKAPHVDPRRSQMTPRDPSAASHPSSSLFTRDPPAAAAAPYLTHLHSDTETT
jgi:hypothetical protein